MANKKLLRRVEGKKHERKPIYSRKRALQKFYETDPADRPGGWRKAAAALPPILTETDIAALCGGKKAIARAKRLSLDKRGER